MESAAWTSLTPSAVYVYIRLKMQFNYQKGGEGRLILPYSSLTWKFSRGTISKALKELTEFGFIKKVEAGGLQKNPNVFALSNGWIEKSKEIVSTQGKGAIQAGRVPKPTASRIENLEGHRLWER
jgi:DNA-binding PadR family transcriptional regulator